MIKVIAVLCCFAVISIVITAVCVVNGLEPWQFFIANCVAGAVLGVISGMMEGRK